MGRKTRLNRKVISDICTAISANNRPVVAAAKAGIPERTYYDWKKRGIDEPDGIYGELVERMQVAEAEAEVRACAIIAAAAPRYWQAAAWWLERTRPNEYGLRQRRENQGATKEREILDHQSWRRKLVAAKKARAQLNARADDAVAKANADESA